MKVREIYISKITFRLCLMALLVSLSQIAAAEDPEVHKVVVIGGSIYGGGNKGDVEGHSTVTVYEGDLHMVYGGARQADVKGRAFVNINGEETPAGGYILIDNVYGGNDISGTIGTSTEIPTELTEVGDKSVDPTKNEIDNTWNAFVRVSSIDKTDPGSPIQNKVYIGELFGGGNGDYYYFNNEGTHEIYNSEQDKIDGKAPVASNTTDFIMPHLGKTYLEIVGGSIVYAYGGGNNATITDETVICVNNLSDVVSSIIDTNNPNANDTESPAYEPAYAVGELLTDKRTSSMGFNPGFAYPTSAAFQIGSFFGGNNLTAMSIQPHWNLQRGKIRNLYSGGNKGNMTCEIGLLLEIDPVEKNGLVIDNVYGGCRMADVRPLTDTGVDVSPENIQLPDPNYHFPTGLSARVLVHGGDINNVYGGNDISGRVYGGNAVGIYSSIRGDVYGGGNGSYPYTDNIKLKDDPIFSDLYYDPSTAASSAEALNNFRPNAEQVSLRLWGTDAAHPTIIGGSVYVGGNSATLATTKPNPMVELKIGSHVYCDKVFLGNNGENMIKYHAAGEGGDSHDGVLRTMKRTDLTSDASQFNSMDLTDETTFAKYMESCAMTLMPSVVFDDSHRAIDPDREDYIDYSSFFGSFYCGGNVGSMIKAGKTTINFIHNIIIFNKLVGGCNNANVKSSAYNAAYNGGLIGDPDASGNKLELNLSGLKIQPKRWVDPEDKSRLLKWNTIDVRTGEEVNPTGLTPGTSSEDDLNRRLTGGNIYGGCYTSGRINGNVIINLNATIIDRDIVFDEVEMDTESGEPKLYGNDTYEITARHSGVILDQQGMDVLGAALNVFGGGYGKDSEIWGNTTINLNRGYTFQIFGGGEQGVIGKPDDGEGDAYAFNGKTFKYNPNYSCTINMNGAYPGIYRGHVDDNPDMAEAEFIYGGAFFGPICGNTTINLGNGRVFNTFAGSCNADILGHTETYIGRIGFPYVRDFVYGGNDLGGQILGTANFESRVRTTSSDGYDARGKVSNADMLNASAYVEYEQGRVEKIFGGCYGVYDYADPHYGDYFYARGADDTTPANMGTARSGYHKPFMDNAFVNFRPTDSNNPLNTVQQIYGAGEGYAGEKEENKMQNRSYILVDIPQGISTFHQTEIFGAGQCGGVGMVVDPDIAKAPATAHKASAIIDLARGNIQAVYGGSYEEGVTRRTEVNVPVGSTIKLDKIFGGAYGVDNSRPCDVYEANVNWNSSDAIVGAYHTGIYGGNNAFRRTLYGKVNINAPVYFDKANQYFATVYGAGYGAGTWSQYTEVNLNNTARVYEVYGGGQLGRVMNKKSAAAWAEEAYTTAHDAWDELSPEEKAETPEPKPIVLSLDDYTDNGLNNDLAIARNGKKYNTNVIINQGADVCGYMYNGALSGAYAYGGGLGDAGTPNTGDVHGTTYIALLGGKVTKDIYAAGTVGSVNNRYNVATDDLDNTFIASSNAYIEGGTCRNVYGGGWEGSVGYHAGAVSDSPTTDILGETNVVIGKSAPVSFVNGYPAIERNAYGGGEGGPVWGTTHITLNSGFIGYRYFAENPGGTYPIIEKGGGFYQEKLDDETWNGDGTNRLYDSGCIFGGGYIDNSSVDVSNVTMYDGHVRNALFGGGEIAAIGRGTIAVSGDKNSVRTLQGIYKAGQTNVTLYGGHVHRNVFGGGRGYNNLGENGTLYSDGFVFGQTRVNIRGGEIGNETVANEEERKGNGNVFGGGDIGYVYSAYDGGFGVKSGTRYEGGDEGYYYKYEGGTWTAGVLDGGAFVLDGTEKILTEDCKVLIEPYARVLSSSINYDDKDYNVGDYVPIEYLNTLGNKNDSRWNNLDQTGIIIRNAVFAGGNTSSGSDKVYANATTVFGNATASIHDVYNRDLITLGYAHVGGLYGDGNLTFIDGYRELNITNYGTDYYSLASEIDKSGYDNLPEREQAYYELRYKCLIECTDKEGTTYKVGSSISHDELVTVFYGIKTSDGVTPMVDANGIPNATYWAENGIRSRFAGRPMNTIQRADFCGVFGSRMVMQGAQDRVPETVDYNNYTINRVREVSLNKKDDHGNYFGIYNIVNFLGALSSDVDFNDVRKTDNAKYQKNSEAYTEKGGGGASENPYGTATYYDWKAGYINERYRNNANSHNEVALASGVYLELTSEKSTGKGLNEKDWGYITGIVELDLINVQTGIGGGYVYAKNEHGKRSGTGKKHTTVTDLNRDAVSQKQFQYDSNRDDWQTSGNFVHSTQTIIDDCYNISGKYDGGDAVPAHYWYIKGEVYVYDQYISAYTGAPNAYSEQVEIPLTISAASHASMTLLNIQPNLYAYYSSYVDESTHTKISADGKIVLNEVEYKLNDPISYWDWYLLPRSEQALFVENTYVTSSECTTTVGTTNYPAGTYPAGTVLLESDYEDLREEHKPAIGEEVEVYDVAKEKNVDFDEIFRSSNNMGHNTGYLLTYKVNNPTVWDTWYTKVNDASDKNQIGGSGYENGPTYTLTSASQLLGQRSYGVGEVIPKNVYDTYQTAITTHSLTPADQASFEGAYIVTVENTVSKKGTPQHLYPGAVLARSEYTDDEWTALTGKVKEAFVCTHTIQLSPTEYIYMNSKMTETEKETYKTNYPAVAAIIESDIVPAYYCTSDGLYGGDYYEKDKNYRALEAWSSMSASDRANFKFNYDALDLLIDPDYSYNSDGSIRLHPVGQLYQYDSDLGDLSGAEANPAGYSLPKSVDYTATYNGTSNLVVTTPVTVKRKVGETITTLTNQTTIQPGDELERADFETIPNEQRHYIAINVENTDATYYVVKEAFQVGNSPYAVGAQISSEVYKSLNTEEKLKVTELTFTTGGYYYYCREPYEIKEFDITSATGVTGATGGNYTTNDNVPLGVVIDAYNYNTLFTNNKQKNFVIHGIAPTETSTLYVSRNSDIFDLSKEKIITVIYQYDYEESDADGNVTPVSERHIVNIHIDFKSGIPEIENIKRPQIILPGTKLGLREPLVTPGAYEITGGGWELFKTSDDAEKHINGIEYSPALQELYWYQNGFYVAYYAKSYLGKTYSNHELVTVANYHDLTKVLADTEHYYFVDNPNVVRDSKIYITDSENGATQLKDFYELSKSTLDVHVRNCQNLEFFMHTNVNYDVERDGSWTPIATGTDPCFEGTLHGDGYSINGLNSSLFDKLCGSVYNLGVTGSFTGAGIAEQGLGYVENCWIATTSTDAKTSKPVFGNPTRDSGYQIVNCYYQEEADATNKYTNHSGSYGIPTRMQEKAFYNGTVAYDLNGFYLYKRYNNAIGTASGTAYKYYSVNDDGTLSEPTTAYYRTTDAQYCSTGAGAGYQYVEKRYADGDFRYADGVIPETEDVRAHVVGDETSFYPIWPDDYIYFGQMLTFNWNNSRPHENQPSHIYKSNGRLVNNDLSNRVYRAPAYYQSATMDVAHFNPAVNLVNKSKPKDLYDTDLKDAYPNMTAIDFKGHNDTDWTIGRPGTPGEGVDLFYRPLLDDDGLISITNRDETPNLLVYAPSEAANKKTYDVLTAYFTEPVYGSYKVHPTYEPDPEYDRYKCVAKASTSTIFGHLVQSDLTATNDHLLVDKQDFNCPISYNFDSSYRMWYQRTPDRYVDKTKGWENVSLPFTAELVTTQDKGEITHFYSGSPTAANSTSKIGHEYWLREYTGKEKESDDPEIYVATFNYPDADSDSDDKEVKNTFLWDYYYNASAGHNHQDANADTYQTYYSESRTLTDYPRLAQGKPYIIGFPGSTYYEFDLSGNFAASTTADPNPTKLGVQTISFVSNTGATIAVSDDEVNDKKVTWEGYSFMPNYMSKKEKGYMMNTAGNAFELKLTAEEPKVPVAVATVPFRPYFTKVVSSGAKRLMTRSIIFDSSDTTFAHDSYESEDPMEEEVGEGTLIFRPGRRAITVESTLRHAADVRIVSVGGLNVATFNIEPGAIVTTETGASGVYIVIADGGKYQKKLSVR